MASNNQPKLVIVSDWIRRDLHEPLRHFSQFKIVHLYRKAGYQDMKPEDFENPQAIQWHGPFDLWHKIVSAKPDILQGGEPWASRSSLLITLVTWWYKKTHPQVKLIWPSMENRPLTEKFSFYERSLLGWWGRIYGSASDLVMYLNKGARKNLIEVGIPKSKLKHVIWATWGIDCFEFSPQSKLKIKNQKSKSKKVILFVGKVSEAKGVPWLIEAFEGVYRRLPNTKLVLAGPMDRNSKFEFLNSKQIQNSNDRNLPVRQVGSKGLKDLKFENLKIVSDCVPPLHFRSAEVFYSKTLGFRISDFKNIEYLGIVKNKDLPDLFRQADVVVAPSITTKTWAEQVGMVNLQAMACGVPVVTTRSGAIPEFVKDGEGAILVPEKDAQAIADPLIKLLTDAKWHSSMSQKARQFVVDNYEVKKNIEKVEELLLQL